MAIAITRDDLLGGVAAIASLAIVTGIAAVLLVARDRVRDWRGVPEWKRKREVLKAKRAAAIYTILWRAAFGIACAVEAVRLHTSAVAILLLVPGGYALWAIRGDINAFQRLTGEIRDVERDQGE
jgi:hypothetical protein